MQDRITVSERLVPKTRGLPTDSIVRIGPYRVLRQIGSGGMGEVFEAVDEGIQRHVAIKLLYPSYARNPELVKRMMNEARAVNIINHPGIVQISQFVPDDNGKTYLVMEHLDGESLQDRLRRLEGRLEQAQALRVCQQIASAMSVAHTRGVIHRDLKPANIMLVSDPDMDGGERVKLLDFGIAKVALEDEGLALTTQTGVFMGTPAFMAPEQFSGARHAGEKADVYSLGVILYQCLGGQLPYLAPSPKAQVQLFQKSQPVPLLSLLPTLPKEIDRLVSSMLSIEPEARPSMGQIAAILQRQPSASGTQRIAPPCTLRVGQIVGNYRITGALGAIGAVGTIESGPGALYEAVHIDHSERRVMVLVMPPSFSRDPVAVEGFRAQAKALSMLSDPSLMRVYDYGKLGDEIHYLILEHLRGQSLASFMDGEARRAGKFLNEKLRRAVVDEQRLEAVRICQRIAQAVALAHAEGVCYGDLTPGTVLLCQDQRELRPKVCPFGLGALLDERTWHRRPGRLRLSPLPFAPSHDDDTLPDSAAPSGTGEDGERADVCSLGVILYRMLTQKSPRKPYARIAPHALSLLVHRMMDTAGDEGKKAGSLTMREAAQRLETLHAELKRLQRVTFFSPGNLLKVAVLLFALAIWQLPASWVYAARQRIAGWILPRETKPEAKSDTKPDSKSEPRPEPKILTLAPPAPSVQQPETTPAAGNQPAPSRPKDRTRKPRPSEPTEENQAPSPPIAVTAVTEAAPKMVHLTLHADGPGTVELHGAPCNGATCTVAADTNLQLVVKPDRGARLSAFTGLCSKTSPSGSGCTFQVPQTGGSVGATFGMPQFSVEIHSAAPCATFQIRLGESTQKCGQSCKIPKIGNLSSVSVEAISQHGCKFQSWESGCTGQNPRCTLVVDKNLSLTASFNEGGAQSLSNQTQSGAPVFRHNSMP